MEKNFLFSNGHQAETEHGPRAHSLHSACEAQPQNQTAWPDVAQDVRRWPTCRCPHPHWVRTEHAAMAERAHRAASAVRPVGNGYGMSHDKVFTVSTQGAR
jgi:hypothetical protein